MARQFSIPSKIPRDYKDRVLARLLPPKEELGEMGRSQLLSLLEKKAELEHLIDTDPARFLIPNPGGQHAFLTEWDNESSARVLLFLAGNKAGKTTGEAILMSERLVGHALWDLEHRSHIKYPTPAVGILFAEDFDSHTETILPNIWSWTPRKYIRGIRRNNIGQPVQVDYKNGSVLRFRTYAQDVGSAEGKDWDLVGMDEPPPRSLYTAVLRGLVATGGKMFVGATLLKEGWLFDETDLAHAKGFGGSIHDNPWLDADAKQAFLDTLTDEEREVRETGRPIHLTGLIYKYFTDDDPYVIPQFALSPRVPYFIGVDPHERRPVHILFGCVSARDEIIIFDWMKASGAPPQIFEALDARIKELQIPAPIRACIMDPNRGKARQLSNTSWGEEFESHGFDVVYGDDNMQIGHSKMYEYLTINPKTHYPRLLFTEACRGKGGPIYQMMRYAWADWAQKRVERNPKETPKEAFKDFPDICRYIVMENLTYDALMHGPAILDSMPKGMRIYGRVA